MGQNHSWAMQTTGLSIQEASRSCNHQQRLFYKVLNKVFNTYSLCHFTLFIMTQLVYLNVLISLYEFNIWLDGYIWWKFCVNSPLRNPLTDKNADVSNTYFPRCICVFCHLSVLETCYNFWERSNWFPLEICFKFTQNAFITVKVKVSLFVTW